MLNARAKRRAVQVVAIAINMREYPQQLAFLDVTSPVPPLQTSTWAADLAARVVLDGTAFGRVRKYVNRFAQD